MIKRSGYVYGKGTRQGFERLRKKGIHQPKFSLLDGIARGAKKAYDKAMYDMLKLFLSLSLEGGLLIESGKLVTDGKISVDDLLNSLKKRTQGGSESDELKELTKEMRLHPETYNRAVLSSIVEKLKNHYKEKKQETDVKLLSRFDRQFYSEQKQFFNDFFTDADSKTQTIFAEFSIDKKELFAQNMESLRKLYLDEALKRIDDEKNNLKKDFLKKLTDYVTGKTDTLDIKNIVLEMEKTSVHVSKFFARDQMSRFNKALTLSSFMAAGVKTVRWLTVGDGRVRDSHKALNGKIFDIKNLPKEADDYLCRCALVPEDYEE